ncbi:MAG: 50S ribosomal protein L30 [Acidimicrobiia bacterium]|nr:50S ribosomal protein L30 [Acidimicrobiia bacterium]
MAKKKTTLRITLVRSAYGQKPKTRACVETLGLRKIRQTVERPDTPDVRGLLARVQHLVEIEEA